MLKTITAHFSRTRLDEGQHLTNTDHENPVQQEIAPFPEPSSILITV